MKRENYYEILFHDFHPLLEDVIVFKEKASGTDRIFTFLIVYKGKYYSQKMLMSRKYVPVGEIQANNHDIIDDLKEDDNLILEERLTDCMYKELVKMINEIDV